MHSGVQIFETVGMLPGSLGKMLFCDDCNTEASMGLDCVLPMSKQVAHVGPSSSLKTPEHDFVHCVSAMVAGTAR